MRIQASIDANLVTVCHGVIVSVLCQFSRAAILKPPYSLGVLPAGKGTGQLPVGSSVVENTSRGSNCRNYRERKMRVNFVEMKVNI